MAIPIEQIVASSYPNIVAEDKKPANQWEESAALRFLDKMGAIYRVTFGESIELPVDYRANPDAAILVSDQDTAALVKTETLTSASFDIAQLNVPVTWTKFDDIRNSSEVQKVDFVKAIIENGLSTHDDLLEQTVFTTSTAGGVEINGLDVLVPTSGAGSPGGISASTETWWQNHSDTYVDATDIEATLTQAYNEALKGTGSPMGPKFILSGATPHALFESVLQAQQRFVDVKEADGGFKVLMFKSLPWAWSQYGGSNVYLLNPKSYRMLVSKQAYKEKSQTMPIQGQNAFYFLIYTAMQNVVNNKSRLAVIHL